MHERITGKPSVAIGCTWLTRSTGCPPSGGKRSRGKAACAIAPLRAGRDSAITSLSGTALLNRTSKASARRPAPAFAQQDARFVRAFATLRGAISAHAFPAASVAVTSQGKLVALKSFGRFTFDRKSSEVTPQTIFDLASVSKVIATTPMAMILYERGNLDLEMPVRHVMPEFAGEDPRRDEVTIRMLLAHSSGLPAYEKLFERVRTREQLLRAAYELPLVAEPGSVAAYSDMGFIILGDRKSTRLNSSHEFVSRMPSSA